MKIPCEFTKPHPAPPQSHTLNQHLFTFPPTVNTSKDADMVHLHYSDAHTHHFTNHDGLTCLCAAQLSDWSTIKEIASPQLIPFFGIHPWFLDKESFENQLQLLEEYLISCPIAGVGEIGLDKTLRKSTDFSFQKEAFYKQLHLATRYHRPIATHCVKSWGTLGDYLSSCPQQRIIVHGWNGSLSPTQLKHSQDFLLSVGWREFLHKPETIRSIPLEHLALESDATDKPLADLYSAISDYLGLSSTELCLITEKNLKRLLSLT